jgi:hypothetical protein
VDGAVLMIVPRPVPLLSPAAYPGYDAFLRVAFSGRGNTLARRVNVSPAALDALGRPRDATPGSIPAESYASTSAQGRLRRRTHDHDSDSA